MLEAVQQVKAAGPQLHSPASHDAGGRGLQAVMAASQRGLGQELGSRLEADLEEGGGAGLDAQAIAGPVAPLHMHHSLISWAD